MLDLNISDVQSIQLDDPYILVSIVGKTKVVTWQEPGSTTFSTYVIRDGRLIRKQPAGSSPTIAKMIHDKLIQSSQEEEDQGYWDVVRQIQAAIRDGVLSVDTVGNLFISSKVVLTYDKMKSAHPQDMEPFTIPIDNSSPTGHPINGPSNPGDEIDINRAGTDNTLQPNGSGGTPNSNPYFGPSWFSAMATIDKGHTNY